MSQIRTWKQSLLLAIAILLWALFTPLTFAQVLKCGDIIGLDEIVPVVDCENPFGVEVGAPFEFTVEEVVVNDGDTVFVEGGKTGNYRVADRLYPEMSPFPGGHGEKIYLHDGNDYREVETEYQEITTADYNRYAIEYFGELTSAAQLYISQLQGEDVDTNSPDWSYEEYFAFGDYVEENYVSGRPMLEAGTYTLVVEEFLLILSQTDKTWLEVIREVFIKTAQAQYTDYPIGPKYALTFTIAEAVPEPEGASSVLFIPGIMGSRLYEESSVCEGDALENERWFSFDECDQLRMSTNIAGQGLNNLYTKAGTQAIIDNVRELSNVYETFLESMEEWKDEEIINEYGVLPYDWRLGLDSIIRSELNLATGHISAGTTGAVEDGYLYGLIEDLSADSLNGKVTIVAHSNGGLVAKHFLDALDKANDPLLDKIENLILVAVPQVGTPEAVIGILHGLDLGPFGFVMNQKTARQLSNKMNFAHHLLPTLRYFENVSTPVITIEPGASTEAWRNEFGDTISSRDTLHDFLDDDSARTKPVSEDLDTPEVVDGILLEYAKVVDTVQSEWTVPETLKVYQVAGTGLDTPSGLTYFTDRTCVNRTFFVCTEYADKTGYRVNMTLDGDASVVVPSALMLADSAQTERWWLNLFNYNDDATVNRDHKNILEVEETNDFVKQTILGATSTNFTYLTNTAPVLDNDESRLVFQLHSPLDMSLHTSDGREISSSTETIEGGTYRRYGELQYISVPGTEEDIVLSLRGLATGSFTLDIERLENGDIVRQTYSAVPSSTSTEVEVPITSVVDLSEAVLVLDYDGDGITDAEYDTQGIIENEITYEDLFESIQSLNLKRTYEKVLLTTAKTAEKLYERSLVQIKYKKAEVVALHVLKQQLVVYEKLRIITRIQSQGVVQIIDELINR